MESRSIGKELAINLFNSKWWERFTPRQIAVFQLFTDELCCDWNVFHESVETSLGRSVWSHQFGSSGIDDLREDLNATNVEYEEVKKAIEEVYAFNFK